MTFCCTAAQRQACASAIQQLREIEETVNKLEECVLELLADTSAPSVTVSDDGLKLHMALEHLYRMLARSHCALDKIMWPLDGVGHSRSADVLSRDDIDAFHAVRATFIDVRQAVSAVYQWPTDDSLQGSPENMFCAHVLTLQDIHRTLYYAFIVKKVYS